MLIFYLFYFWCPNDGREGIMTFMDVIFFMIGHYANQVPPIEDIQLVLDTNQ